MDTTVLCMSVVGLEKYCFCLYRTCGELLTLMNGIGHVLRVLGVCPGHSLCDDFTCKTANERARIPSLDQSQCSITVLSLRKVEAKTA